MLVGLWYWYFCASWASLRVSSNVLILQYILWSSIFFLVLTIWEGFEGLGHKSLYGFSLSKWVFTVIVGLKNILMFLRIYLCLHYCWGSWLLLWVSSICYEPQSLYGFSLSKWSSVSHWVFLHYRCQSLLYFEVLSIFICPHYCSGSSLSLWVFSIFCVFQFVSLLVFSNLMKISFLCGVWYFICWWTFLYCILSNSENLSCLYSELVFSTFIYLWSLISW